MNTSRMLIAAVALSALVGRPNLTGATPVASSSGAGDLFARLDVNGDGRLTSDEIVPEHQRLFARLLRQADEDGDRSLTLDEFAAGLAPSRPNKPLVEYRRDTFRDAPSLRYLLLRMDTNCDRRIEPNEVPDDLRPTFATMVRQTDRNQNGTLDYVELVGEVPKLLLIAGRYTQQHGIDAASAVAKMRQSQGADVDRFDWERLPGRLFGRPKQAGQLFHSLDRNGDGRVDASEVPEHYRQSYQWVLEYGDRDGDGRLTWKEFVMGAKALPAYLNPASRGPKGDQAMQSSPPTAAPDAD